MARRVRIVPAVTAYVAQHPSPEAKNQFWKAWERLSEATDPWSWEELGALPVHDAQLPKGSFQMGFGLGNACHFCYWERPDGDLEIITAYLHQTDDD